MVEMLPHSELNRLTAPLSTEHVQLAQAEWHFGNACLTSSAMLDRAHVVLLVQLISPEGIRCLTCIFDSLSYACPGSQVKSPLSISPQIFAQTSAFCKMLEVQVSCEREGLASVKPQHGHSTSCMEV